MILLDADVVLADVDKVLSYICHGEFFFYSNDPVFIFESFKKQSKMDQAVFHKILFKLSNDGYLYLSQSQLGSVTYSLTIEGILFNKAGGYTKAFETSRRKRKIQNVKDYLLIVGTWLAGIGAVSLVVWEIYKASSHHYF